MDRFLHISWPAIQLCNPNAVTSEKRLPGAPPCTFPRELRPAQTRRRVPGAPSAGGNTALLTQRGAKSGSRLSPSTVSIGEPVTSAAQVWPVSSKVRPIGPVRCGFPLGPLMKHAQGTWVSPAGIPTRACLRSRCAWRATAEITRSLAGARTVDYSHARGSRQSGDAPSSARSGRPHRRNAVWRALRGYSGSLAGLRLCMVMRVGNGGGFRVVIFDLHCLSAVPRRHRPRLRGCPHKQIR
jgi:hypothetical protein